jgi:NAD(P)H-hydrate epimerase
VAVGIDSARSPIESADVIVDALLGIGVQGDVREPIKTLIDVINGSGKPVLAVDVPSGFGSATSIRPTMTVTFHDIKNGMNEENSGKIVKVDIGIPSDADRFTGPGELVYYPLPARESHKGQNGVLLVISGGPFTGAPALVGLAALRAGCDLVRIAVPERVWQVVASFSPALIVRSLAGDFLNPSNIDDLLEMAREADAAVIGPGLGQEHDTMEAVREFASKVDIPFVVDADGITAIADDLEAIRDKKCIVTPHKAELKRLCGEEPPEGLDERIRFIESFSKENGFTVLFKGPVDIVAGEGRSKLNRTGNVAMTVGGTGDVLAGICGSLLARDVEPFNAARLGAFISGSSGDLAFERLGHGLTPMDVVEEIPKVLRTFLKT